MRVTLYASIIRKTVNNYYTPATVQLMYYYQFNLLRADVIV